MLPECVDCLKKIKNKNKHCSRFGIHFASAAWDSLRSNNELEQKIKVDGILQNPHLSLFSQVWQYALDKVSTAPRGKYNQSEDGCLPYDLHSPCQSVS